MIAMQYKVSLSEEYDMRSIRERVLHNGFKTDDFPGLLYKAYLIKDNSESQSGNEYAPFYIWNSSEGMNSFLFDGFYDNILTSFGWQQIHIGVPLLCELKDAFPDSRYVYEIKHSIPPLQHMQRMQFSRSDRNSTGRVLIYNPDFWQYTEFYFYESKQMKSHEGQLYEILHISLSK